MSALPIGFGMGLLVAAQIGPMSLFLIRSVLRGSLRPGSRSAAASPCRHALRRRRGRGRGAGAAIDSVRVVFGVAGALVLAVLGVRTLHSAFRVRLGAEADEEVATAAARVRHLARRDGVEPADDRVVGGALRRRLRRRRGGHAGVGGRAARRRRPREPDDGHTLALGVSVTRRWVGARLLRTVDAVAGTGLLGFAGMLGYRTLREP